MYKHGEISKQNAIKLIPQNLAIKIAKLPSSSSETAIRPPPLNPNYVLHKISELEERTDSFSSVSRSK